MNTEITDRNAKKPVGWIFYDAECAFCLRWLHRTERLFVCRGFRFVPLQTDWARERLCLTDENALEEMRLLLANGKIFGGADAALELARRIGWAWPLWLISKVPGVIFFCRGIYRHIAKNRSCAISASGKQTCGTTEARNRHSAFFQFP